MTREEWCRRFRAEMVRVALFAGVGPPHGITWTEYAAECAEPFYEECGPATDPEEIAAAEVLNHDLGDDPQ